MTSMEVLIYKLSQGEVEKLNLHEFNAELWEKSPDWWRMACLLLGTDAWKYDRKLRQFACACCRQYWDKFLAPTRRALQLTEIYADCIAISKRLQQNVDSEARNAVNAKSDSICHMPYCMCEESPDVGYGFSCVQSTEEHEEFLDRTPCADYFRDLVYNPFRTAPAFEEDWLFRNNARVYLLAQEIYYAYRFELMPRLAAELKGAGCANQEILDHCRLTRIHCRGCWVIDGLLKPDKDPLKRLLSRAPIPGDRLAAYLMSDDPKDPFSLYCG